MKLRFASVIMMIFSSAFVFAQDRPVGLGVVLGEPTGLTAKVWTGRTEAFDLGLAYSFNDFILGYGDYLWHFPQWLSGTSLAGKNLTPYVGIGGVLWISSDNGRSDGKFFTSHGATVGLGARVPIGIEWAPRKPPLGIFAELVPGMGIIPSVFPFLEGGVGVRFYF